MSLFINAGKRQKLFSIAEIAIIILLAGVPLFAAFPYRVNIFLSWEGAYRMSQGQVPYKDFGMPLGYMYWVVPAFFFKLFGPQMITLIKAQVLLNIVSGLAFRSILKSLKVQPGIVFLSVLLYCLSYSFFNFWPWYNHTVIVYEMCGLAFLMHYICSEEKVAYIWLVLSALFIFFSFFTKQDGGGLAFVLCCALLLYYCIVNKKWLPFLVFTGSAFAIGTLFILPLTKYSFGYWFNHGQEPHQARFSALEVVNEFFMASQWIKFYLCLVILMAVFSIKNRRTLFSNQRFAIFLLLTLGILAEAAILQVTSYTPPDNNIFFHSFAVAFILSALAGLLQLNFFQPRYFVTAGCGLLLWWSGTYWKYFQRITTRVLSQTTFTTGAATENVVTRQTYMVRQDSADIPMSEWVYTGLKSFDKIYMPKPTADGISRVMNMDIVKSGKPLRVLNMTELTPLAAEMGYSLETGADYPLWYHLGVSMFNREAAQLEQKIQEKKYDLVLFEYIPTLNNFYPFRTRNALLHHYQKVDSFSAPRRGDTRGMIEVFVP